MLGAGAAAAVARPAFSFAKTAAGKSPAAISGIVRLSSNENPYGPSAQALKAMSDAFPLACRYPDEHADALVEALAKLNRVGRDQILLGDGSGEILKLAADVFTGPLSKGQGGALVVADPTFEAILYHAQRNGAEIVKVRSRRILVTIWGRCWPQRRAAWFTSAIRIIHRQHHSEKRSARVYRARA